MESYIVSYNTFYVRLSFVTIPLQCPKATTPLLGPNQHRKPASPHSNRTAGPGDPPRGRGHENHSYYPRRRRSRRVPRLHSIRGGGKGTTLVATKSSGTTQNMKTRPSRRGSKCLYTLPQQNERTPTPSHHQQVYRNQIGKGCRSLDNPMHSYRFHYRNNPTTLHHNHKPRQNHRAPRCQ